MWCRRADPTTRLSAVLVSGVSASESLHSPTSDLFRILDPVSDPVSVPSPVPAVRMLIENNETFLSELSKLFAEGQASGHSLFLAMKRYSGRTKPLPRKRSAPNYKPVSRSQTSDESVTQENKCLIRASLGNHKISTVVAAKDMNRFQMAYSNLLKGNLHGLKKKDRKKESKGATSTSRATQ